MSFFTFDIFFLRLIFKIFLIGGGGVPWENFWIWIFYFLLFHRCNNINITYQQFYCCLHWYLTHSYRLLYFDVFPFPWKVHFWPLKMYLLPQFWGWYPFHLGGWNRYHFVGNLIPYTVTYHFLNIQSLSCKNMQHQQKN